MNEKWQDYNPRINELISLGDAAEIYGFTTNHLRLIISQERLWARKIGNTWLTTEYALNEYLKNRSKRGRKPKKS